MPNYRTRKGRKNLKNKSEFQIFDWRETNVLYKSQQSPKNRKPCTSLIIEHSDDDHSRTAVGRTLDEIFPDFDRW
jgi:hypothetical protein